MLPSEKSEIMFMEIGKIVLILLALYIVGWVIHNAYTSLHRIDKSYDLLNNEGRAPIVQIASLSQSLT